MPRLGGATNFNRGSHRDLAWNGNEMPGLAVGVYCGTQSTYTPSLPTECDSVQLCGSTPPSLSYSTNPGARKMSNVSSGSLGQIISLFLGCSNFVSGELTQTQWWRSHNSPFSVDPVQLAAINRTSHPFNGRSISNGFLVVSVQ